MRTKASIAACVGLAALLAGPAASPDARGGRHSQLQRQHRRPASSSRPPSICAASSSGQGRDEYLPRHGFQVRHRHRLDARRRRSPGRCWRRPPICRPRSLNGNYGGVGAEATVGLGVGANALLGGSSRSIILQPLSVQAQKGLNLAAGVQSLELSADHAVAEAATCHPGRRVSDDPGSAPMRRVGGRVPDTSLQRVPG